MSKKRSLSEWLLLPFTVYVFIAPIALFLWHEMTAGQKIRGGLAEGTSRVLLGYSICFVTFVFAAIIHFLTRRRELVAENLMMAGLVFIIFYSLGPYAATA